MPLLTSFLTPIYTRHLALITCAVLLHSHPEAATQGMSIKAILLDYLSPAK